MPRDVYILDNFVGGLSNYPDMASLKKNELYVADDVFMGKSGSIRTIGTFIEYTVPESWINILGGYLSNFTAGYGLYTFMADHHINPTATTQGSYNFYVFAGHDGTTKCCVIAEDNGAIHSTDGTGRVAIASNDLSTFYPSFYYADGGLRMSDGNLDSTKSATKWFGYIDTKHFDGLTPGGSCNVYIGYYSYPSAPVAPSDSFAGSLVHAIADAGSTNVILVEATAFANITTSFFNRYVAVNASELKAVMVTGSSDVHSVRTGLVTDWAGDSYYIFPPPGGTFTVNVNESGSGTWTTGSYEIGVSFVYHGGQESLITTAMHTGASDLFKITSANVGLYMYILATSPYPANVSGGRVYIRNKDGGSWLLLSDISLKNGARASFADKYTGWQLFDFERVSPATSGVYCYASFASPSPNADTYESINGINSNTTSLSVLFKTAAVANRRAYIGNARIGGQKYLDSIFKSKVNKFDVFSVDDRLDVALDDGESVTALMVFADRIFEFKDKTLYIINIGQQIEYVESVHKYMGITHSNHVVNTEYGIVWMNDRGVYLYNGESIIDLFSDLEDASRRKIDLYTWSSYISNDSAIGYDSFDKQIVIVKDLSSASDNDIYLYDMLTKTWSIGKNKFGSYNYSNLITNSSGLVVSLQKIGVDWALVYWDFDYSGGSSRIVAETAQLDFEIPNIRKNVYKVYIQHKHAAGMIAKYRTNSTTDLYTFTTGLFASSTSWVYQEFKPSNISESHNIKTFGLRLYVSTTATVVSKDFAVNKVAIVYKVKGAR